MLTDLDRSRLFPAPTRSGYPRLLADALLLLVIVLALLAFVLVAIPEHFVESHGGDYPYYVEIARTPLTNDVPSPWRYRLLNPLLASLLMRAGLPTDLAFLSLTTVFAFASCMAMRVYLERLGLSRFASLAGALLFTVSVGGYVPLRRYYGYTDALTNFFILLILIAAAGRRHVATAVALAVGTFAKESMLLLLPFLARRITAATSWRVALAVALAPVLVFAALRLGVSNDASGAPVALTLEAQVEYWKTAMVHGPVRWILWALAYSMGPVWLLGAAAVPRNVPFLKTMALYAIPLLVPLVRTTDTERALMLLFPIVFPLAAQALGGCQRDGRALWIAAAAVACTWLAQLTFEWVPQFRVGPLNAKDIAFVILCIVPVAAVLHSRSRAKRAPAPLAWP